MAGVTQVGDFVRFAGQRGIDLSRLLVAEAGGKMLWSLLPIPSPGRTVLLFGPSQFVEGRRWTRRRCSSGRRATTPGGPAQLAQVLLEPADAGVRALFQDLGFVEMAELIYLHAAVRKPAAPPDLPPGFALTPYSAATHGLFAWDRRQLPGQPGLPRAQRPARRRGRDPRPQSRRRVRA